MTDLGLQSRSALRLQGAFARREHSPQKQLGFPSIHGVILPPLLQYLYPGPAHRWRVAPSKQMKKDKQIFSRNKG